MPLTQEEAVRIETYLEQIYSYISAKMRDQDLGQVRKYIDANEYGLALDDMACIALEGSEPVASDLRRLFGEAADLMAIKPGDGWSGVDDLRAST